LETELDEHAIPAILREPLHKVILDVKRLNQPGEPKQILSLAIQPPKINDIERTILLLKEVGALSLKHKLTTPAKMRPMHAANNPTNVRNDPHDGDLTYVGRIMATLPIDVKLSKLILLGHAFGKLRDCIVIAAGLSTKTFFTCYYKSHLESFQSKWYWSEGWMCDCLAILNAYNVYERLSETGAFEKRGEDVRWAKKYMIEINRIREVEKLKRELEQRLLQANILCNRHVKINDRRRQGQGENLDYDIDKEDQETRNMLLKLIIAGAFYPNYYYSFKVDLKEAVRMLSGRDMKNTVQIKNLPLNEAILYTEKLTEIFRPCSKLVQVHYEDTKAYVKYSFINMLFFCPIYQWKGSSEFQEIRTILNFFEFFERIFFANRQELPNSETGCILCHFTLFM
jgi:ATP-dependent RNA helicase TDRD9